MAKSCLTLGPTNVELEFENKNKTHFKTVFLVDLEVEMKCALGANSFCFHRRHFRKVIQMVTKHSSALEKHSADEETE